MTNNFQNGPRHFISLLKDESKIVYRRFIDNDDPTNFTRVMCKLSNFIDNCFKLDSLEEKKRV